MVYYGKLSKGCQLCRQRKVKCDQERPKCQRCLRSDLHCPGYRNLDEFLFRDEYPRVIQKVSNKKRLNHIHAYGPGKSPDDLKVETLKYDAYDIGAFAIATNPSPSIDGFGAAHFFHQYLPSDNPIAMDFHAWLGKHCIQNGASSGLQSIIEALGLSAICNMSHGPQLEYRAKKCYHNAVKDLNRILSRPEQAILDTTLMTVIMLGQYEIVNFKALDQQESWLTHAEASCALLDLRGPQQFKRERAAQLYIHARASIVSSCAQQQRPIPLALVQVTQAFQSSEIRREWRNQHVASPASLCELSFRIVNLMAALNAGSDNVTTLLERAMDINEDLKIWEEGLPPDLRYSTISTKVKSDCKNLGTERHVYQNLWCAEVWNNWRLQRFIINQMILQVALPQDSRITLAVCAMQEMSRDICVSALNFRDSPRRISLIEPLYLLSTSKAVSVDLRHFAVEELRNIGRSTGVRQATVLANAAAKMWSGVATHFKCDIQQ